MNSDGTAKTPWPVDRGEPSRQLQADHGWSPQPNQVGGYGTYPAARAGAAEARVATTAGTDSA